MVFKLNVFFLQFFECATYLCQKRLKSITHSFSGSKSISSLNQKSSAFIPATCTVEAFVIRICAVVTEFCVSHATFADAIGIKLQESCSSRKAHDVFSLCLSSMASWASQPFGRVQFKVEKCWHFCQACNILTLSLSLEACSAG